MLNSDEYFYCSFCASIVVEANLKKSTVKRLIYVWEKWGQLNFLVPLSPVSFISGGTFYPDYYGDAANHVIIVIFYCFTQK